MISAILWLMALSAMIAIARLMARRRCQTLTSFETGRLNERYAGRYAAFVTAAAVAFAALIAVVASNGGRLGPLWAILAGGLVGAFAVWRIKAQFHARKAFETAAVAVMAVIAGVAVVTTFGIFLTLIVESVLFFNKVPIQDFLFGRAWSPQTAIRADQVASEGAFGVLPLITGTLLVTGIALLVAYGIGAGICPTCLFAMPSAILGQARAAASAFGVIMTGRNIGVLIGPILIAQIFKLAGDWNEAAPVFAGLTLIAVALGLVLSGTLARVAHGTSR